MPINKNAAFRYRIIDGCLRNSMRKYPTLQMLKEMIMEGAGLNSLSDSQINKDIRAMKDIYNAPIENHKIYGGYYYTEEDFSINSFPLTHDEIRVLDMSSSILKQIKYSGYFNQFESVIDKLISGFRISQIPGYENRQIIEVEQPISDTGLRWIEMAYESIINKLPLHVDYKKFNSDETKQHIFSAYIIREYRNRWYINGYSEKSEAITTLALDRVVNMELMKGGYRSADFDAKDFFKYGFGATVYSDSKPFKVELLFDNSLAGYMLTKPLHSTQKILEHNEDFLHLEIECYLTPELEGTILSYAEKVKVLAPQELIDRVKTRAEGLVGLYK
jgi:predicted DNA-binding transcriptional regulator YafY